MIYKGKKVELDGMKFDSKSERDFYERFIKPSGKRFLFHPAQVRYKKYKNHGIWCRGKGYTPDFIIQGDDGSWLHIYDVKSSLNPRGMGADARDRIEDWQQRTGHMVELVVPRRNDFKMKLIGPTERTIQARHVKRNRRGEVKYYPSGNPQYEYYDVHTNIDYDIHDTIGM